MKTTNRPDIPDGVSASEINSHPYNRDTNRRVQSTQKLASFIKEEVDRRFPLYASKNASMITHFTRYAPAELRHLKELTNSVNE